MIWSLDFAASRVAKTTRPQESGEECARKRPPSSSSLRGDQATKAAVAVFAALVFSRADAIDPPSPTVEKEGGSAGTSTEVLDSTGTLQEVTVTATRRSSSVNRVPLSITALTAEALQQQAVRGIDDVRRVTPGLGLVYGNNSPTSSTSADTNISLRGISAASGAATTGVYIDEVPIHKTALQGNGFGAPYPKLFDIDRIEVLRGPQGTLYGGSTEGGAIRFILPSPSLTEYSGQVRSEVSATDGGAPSYEAGAAVGGPIVTNLLGFRLSVWGRRDGGYIDHVSRFTGDTLATNTNSENSFATHASLLWSPTENLKITPAVFFQIDKHNDTDQFWENTPAINAPALGFTASGRNCTTALPLCAFVLPAHTYGPYNMFGPFKNGDEIISNGQESPALAPRDESLALPSLAIDYTLGSVLLKSITAYGSDNVTGDNQISYKAGVPLVLNVPNYPANEAFTAPNFFSTTYYFNDHRQLSEELRLSSAPGSRLSWVGGVYSYISHLLYQQTNFDNEYLLDPAVHGASYQSVNGFPVYGLSLGNPEITGIARTSLVEKNLAVFGEATYALTDQLGLIAGVRASHDEVQFEATALGDRNRGATVATVANGGYYANASTEKPVTPKAGVTFQINSNDMAYATVAKGYRDGGFNTPGQSQTAICLSTLATLGLPAIPLTYQSDNVWSYELGSKLRLWDGRAQLNSSAYYIDWKNIQTQVALPNCGQYTANAAAAVSKGADVQADILVFRDLTLSGTGSYDDAQYTSAVFTPTLSGGQTLIIDKGDPLRGVPRWTGTLGGEYRFNLPAGIRGFVRADYQYVGDSYRSTGVGTIGYTPTVYRAGALHFATARAGAKLSDQLEVSVFGKNLTNSQDRTFELGGTTATRVSPVLFGQTFRPLEIGVTASYAF